MNKVMLLQYRLKEIGQSLKYHHDGLGLLGLGSAGKALDRMDEYSDLDFFAIVRDGHKQRFIENLDWLSNIQDIAWCFKNSADGYKLLFVDGVFCEFAVFEADELVDIPYSEGRFIWRDECISAQACRPMRATPENSQDQSFLIGELLTNLYVGLCRYRRGEKCSAMRFIQVYAVDRMITLLDMQQSAHGSSDKDEFCLDRRVEQRHPKYQQLLMQCTQGSEKCSESALVMLDYVIQQYRIDNSLVDEIKLLF